MDKSRFASQSTKEMRSRWDDEHILFDGDSFFTDVLQAIGQAKRSVTIETYIFDIDALGQKIERALSEAARRGVSVRLLVDGVGASTWTQRHGPHLESTGVQVRVFHPLHKPKTFAHFMWLIGFRARTSPERRRFFWRVNRRTHRKLIVVDNETAWVGSLNISAHHCVSLVGPQAWRDTAVRVRGDAVQDLLRAFDYAWIRSHTLQGRRRWRDSFLPRLTKRFGLHSPLVRLNYTNRLRRRSLREFLIRIQTARRRIWITTPYLSPTTAVMRALRKASEKGVDVRILHPRKSDVFFMPWVASVYYRPLLKSGVRIFEYLPRFLHAKSAIIDDWSIVGTSNMNRRSWFHDLEVDVVLSHEESLETLKDQFLADLRSTEEIHSPAQGFTGFLGRLFSYLLKDVL